MVTLIDVLMYEADVQAGKKFPDYPYRWCCYDCGVKYGDGIPFMATYHDNKCDLCEEEKSVTSPRKFGWPRKEK